MTKLQKDQALEMLDILVQRMVNGKKYLKIEVEDINYCGGYQIAIKDTPLLHDDDVLGIITLCNRFCLQFKLELNEKAIRLI